MLQEIEEVVSGLSNEERIVLKSKLEIRKKGLEEQQAHCSSMTHAKKYFSAVGAYSKLLELCPNNAFLLSNRGYCRYEMGDFDLALMDFAICLSLYPNFAKVHYRMANTYLSLRKFDKALIAIECAIKSDVGNEKYVEFYERTKTRLEQEVLFQGMDGNLEGLEKITDVNEAIKVVNKNGFYIDWMSESMQENKLVALAAVKCCGAVLEMTVWQDDTDVVLEAIKNSPLSVRYASQRLRDNKDIAKAAVSRNGVALRYVPAFSDDPEIVLIAIKTTPKSLKWASKRLRSDPETILASIKVTSLSFRSNCPAYLRDNKEFMMKVVEIAPNHLRFGSDAVRNDKEVCLKAVEKNGKVLEFVGDMMRCDRTVVIAAMEKNRLAYSFADFALQNDKEILMLASPWFARLLSDRNQRHHDLRLIFQ